MKEDRINELQNYILEKERASIEELCSVFNVSKNTMRRDINQLESQGKIKKVYGGIILTDKKTTEPFESREVKNKDAKLIIAKLASTLIEDGDIIYIDSGTTTMHMIPYLSDVKNLTIVTNNLHVILKSLPYQNLNVISTGGTLFRRTNSFVDSGAVSSLKKYNISKAFLATTGISIAKGITNSSSLEYDIKKYIVEHCDKKILLADDTKLGKVSLITYYDLKDIQVFVTNQKPDDEYTDFFRSNHITLIAP
ncbi:MULTISPECIES: DeoR/GlpR family DNA-binding transcription regulator [Pelosinus]|uniref:Regulatory protein DeoR n=1 Tax=Pelosinus fermentans B4 TaxID=1149862 RepID=I8RN95_9FIRM|nr:MULTISPECIES: DeoR/GlpR family DNA-binding transcription regulator [Pelosinus]EIW20510.1 regulatory protein DeoR [Pelosinus fermentans B4]EIW25775.1 transcriptional regulator, DeoR family [Pelosinus fermentans A11]OAM93499.1 transcriptional regulator, DeoR family [Pelosinus fermentans DSM 17108]SDQ79940.1 transcriptional regulator, DeoR family [Pelosinus fermentans]